MSFMHKVIINGKIQYVTDGTVLSDVLIGSSETVEHICGGKGTCRKCTVTVNGKKELSCQYRIKSDITVILPEKDEILSETGAKESGTVTENLCCVLDIGTTTLAIALVSLDEEKIIKVVTRTNPQRIFGADVITRIDCCRKNGVENLQQAVVSEVNKMLVELGVYDINNLYVAGNATMLHLFFGVDCSSMAVAPYTP